MLNDGQHHQQNVLSMLNNTSALTTTTGMSMNDILNALSAQQQQQAAMVAAAANSQLTATQHQFNNSGQVFDAASLASLMLGAAAASANNNQSNLILNGSCAAGGGAGQQVPSAEYLAQLLRDKKHFVSLPNLFLHAERLIDEEISKVRSVLFQSDTAKKEALVLPDPVGDVVTVQEKVYVPIKEHPDYNFVGRILGPRGMTAKQLEQETGCKIMVRGKGSMRDKAKEDANRGKPNWEHLNDELHVLIQCEDTENRSTLKMQRATDEVKKLLTLSPEGEDDLKRKQLLELAIINGTYRPGNQPALPLPRLLTPMAPQLRSASLGAPIYLSPPTSAAGGMRTPSLSQAAANGLALQSFIPGATAGALDLTAAATGGFLIPVEQLLSLQAASAFPYAASAFNPQLFSAADYATAESQAGAIQRRILSQQREHPYRRNDASPAKSLS